MSVKTRYDGTRYDGENGVVIIRRRIEISIPEIEYEAIQKITKGGFEYCYNSGEIGVTDNFVTYLDISCLGLKVLNSSISDLGLLQTLDVRWNQLKSLPESICNLGVLQRFYASCNRLKSLPKSIGNLGLLQRFDVCENQLKSLPESIYNLDSLKEFYVSRNQLDNSSMDLLYNLRKKGVHVYT